MQHFTKIQKLFWTDNWNWPWALLTNRHCMSFFWLVGGRARIKYLLLLLVPKEGISCCGGSYSLNVRKCMQNSVKKAAIGLKMWIFYVLFGFAILQILQTFEGYCRCMTSYILKDKSVHHEDKYQLTGHVSNVLIPIYSENKERFSYHPESHQEDQQIQFRQPKMHNLMFWFQSTLCNIQ